MNLDRTKSYARLELAASDGQPAALDWRLTMALESHALTAVDSDPDKAYALFEVESAAAVPATEVALRKDVGWRRALDAAGVAFWRLRFHAGPAGPGRKTVAGQGRLQGDWRTFSIHDGLPSTSVYHMIQDGDDLLWFAMHGGGACSFDGAMWTNYAVADGLVDDRVVSVLEDQRGDLWFATENGLSHYERSGDSGYFTTYTTEDGLLDNFIHRLGETPDGILWIGGQNHKQAYGVRGKTGAVAWREYEYWADQLFNGTTVYFTDRRGCAWLASTAGLLRYREAERCYAKDETILVDDIPYHFIESKSGDIWLTGREGLYRARAGDRLDFELLLERPGAHEQLATIVEDRQGRLWTTTSPSGLLLCERPGETIPSFRHLNIADGLANSQAFSLLEDRQGNFWVGTYGGGVSRLEETHIRNFTAERDGLANDGVMSLLQDRAGDLWFGTFDGASRYDSATHGDAAPQFHSIEAFTGQPVIAIKEDRQGRLWFLLPAVGVCIFDGRTYVYLTEDDGLIHYNVSALLIDLRDRVWVGTRYGLSCYADGAFTNYTTAEGLVHDQVVTLYEDRRGRIWIGTWDGGVSCFDDEVFTNYTTADGLAHDHVNGILEDRQGHLWFTTWGGGINRYNGEIFTNYTTADGLAHDRLRSVYEDEQGHLWFATFGGGVSRYDGRVFQTISRQDGLVHDTAQQILRERDGDWYWIATEGGLTRYKPQDQPPRIELKDVIADRHYGAVEDLSVSVTQDFLIFQFQGVSWTTGPERLAYAYRLAGHDDVQRRAGHQRRQYRRLRDQARWIRPVRVFDLYWRLGGGGCFWGRAG